MKKVYTLCVIVCIFLVFAGFMPQKNDYCVSTAKAMAVIEARSGKLLFSKNENQCLPMASTTKVVTAITVLENVKDFNKIIKVPRCAVGVEGSSIYLQENEELKIIDLLHGLMLQSGNDCAVALAVIVGGNIENFASLMNETAKKANAYKSNFVNPHGLHHDNHYTTAHDLAKITAYAMKNKTFREIVSSKSYSMPWQGRDYNRNIINKNKLLYSLEGADGVKTGYTKKAGRCLVASATRNGIQIISVVLDCGPMFEECSDLINKAFSALKPEDILPIPIKR